MTDHTDLHAQVRDRYARAARAVGDGGEGECCTPDCCNPAGDRVFGEVRYDADQQDQLPTAARLASLGCGNPVAVADLRDGQVVLDLGSGGGIDVILSARRVGPTGLVYGLDMTDEMLELARRNAADAGVANAQFLKGHIEAIPLPDACVDVVISNCVVNLSPDKPAVMREAIRVLRPGGRIGISDVVAEDRLTPAQRAERGDWAGCIAGALGRTEYLRLLAQAGFTEAEVRFTHEVRDGLHGAIITATKPATSGPCCGPACCG